MVQLRNPCILGGAFLSFIFLARADSPSPSPAADTELICPSGNPAECYPRLFQATKDFQIIKEGQDIPPGLHVRMNIYTGEKEARLNIPLEGGDENVVEIPTDQAVVVIPQPEDEPVPAEEEPAEELPSVRERAAKEPPPYDPAGKVKPPPKTVESAGDLETFERAMIVLQMDARGMDKALADLSELSHDIYYGVEIVKDGPALERLVCMMAGFNTDRNPADVMLRDQIAASILGHATQNNPNAVKELKKYWQIVMYPTCGSGKVEDAEFFNKHNFVSLLRTRLGKEKAPATLRAKVSALSGLLHEPTIREHFLRHGGMELLLAIFLKRGEKFDTVRTRVAELVMDNFLDESMGAELGIWPTAPASEGTVCEEKGQMLGQGCWEHHVGRLIEAKKEREEDGEWAEIFLEALKTQRPASGTSIKHEDL